METISPLSLSVFTMQNFCSDLYAFSLDLLINNYPYSIHWIHRLSHATQWLFLDRECAEAMKLKLPIYHTHNKKVSLWSIFFQSFRFTSTSSISCNSFASLLHAKFRHTEWKVHQLASTRCNTPSLQTRLDGGFFSRVFSTLANVWFISRRSAEYFTG